MLHDGIGSSNLTMAVLFPLLPFSDFALLLLSSHIQSFLTYKVVLVSIFVQPKLNDALLEMFRNEYIGTAPYLSCLPSLRHHRLCPTDQFIVLSSDGLYQYLTNEEVVSYVENFMEKFPDGDPAQHLIEELLCRAARKAGSCYFLCYAKSWFFFPLITRACYFLSFFYMWYGFPLLCRRCTNKDTNQSITYN